MREILTAFGQDNLPQPRRVNRYADKSDLKTGVICVSIKLCIDYNAGIWVGQGERNRVSGVGYRVPGIVENETIMIQSIMPAYRKAGLTWIMQHNRSNKEYCIGKYRLLMG